VDYLIVGTISGLFMAVVWVAVCPIMLFVLAKDPSPFFEHLLEKVSPMVLTMSVVILAFPMWIVAGGGIGLIYRATVIDTYGNVAGIPNFAYNSAVVATGIIVATPIAFLLRRVIIGIVVLTVAFLLVFGAFLPFFAR